MYIGGWAVVMPYAMFDILRVTTVYLHFIVGEWGSENQDSGWFMLRLRLSYHVNMIAFDVIVICIRSVRLSL